MATFGPSRPSITARQACPWMVRTKFNEGQFVQRADRGELQLKVPRSYPTPSAQNQVPGTVTQKIEYWTPQGRRLAIAIQYLRPDGTLGGSGRPDPKLLVDGSERLTPSHGDADSCPECAAWRFRALAAR